MKVVFAGGGTGGHINPAISVANYLKSKEENFEALFIGTKRGLETRLVPNAGYNIEYIDICGFDRKNIEVSIPVSCICFNISRFVIIFCSKYCKEYRLVDFMYISAVFQSFHLARSVKSDIVAITGFESGITILKNILSSLAPSILAASVNDCGSPWKNVLITIT